MTKYKIYKYRIKINQGKKDSGIEVVWKSGYTDLIEPFFIEVFNRVIQAIKEKQRFVDCYINFDNIESVALERKFLFESDYLPAIIPRAFYGNVLWIDDKKPNHLEDLDDWTKVSFQNKMIRSDLDEIIDLTKMMASTPFNFLGNQNDYEI